MTEIFALFVVCFISGGLGGALLIDLILSDRIRKLECEREIYIHEIMELKEKLRGDDK